MVTLIVYLEMHMYILDIVLAAGSNKALEIYDMNVEKCVRTVSDAQSRAIHCICQNEVGRRYKYRASHFVHCREVVLFLEV